MNVYRLSSATERTWAVVIAFMLIFGMGVLFGILRGGIFAVCIYILVSVGLLYYVGKVFKAAIIPHPEDSILEVKGFFDAIIYLFEVSSLEIASMRIGPISYCSYLFKDGSGNVIVSVPTCYLTSRIIQAENVAKELANTTGLSFRSAQ